MGKIYVLRCPLTNEIRYCGQTIKDLKYRLNGHVQDSKRSNHHTANWIKSLLSKNLIPIIELVEECDDSLLNEREIFHIARLRSANINLTNNNDGGQSGSCKKHKEESKRKISEFMKHYKKSDEHINKMKAALRKPVHQYTLSGEYVQSFESASHAIVCVNVSITAIQSAIRRKGTAGNFQWRYIKEESVPPIIKYFKSEQFREKIRITNHNRSKKI